jgi:hypothetical protein
MNKTLLFFVGVVMVPFAMTGPTMGANHNHNRQSNKGNDCSYLMPLILCFKYIVTF